MRDFLAVQRFIPIERPAESRCIWCQHRTSKNRAHVISRKLTNSPKNPVVLRSNVCEACNSRCGNIEEWVLRNTPIAWVRLLCYFESNRHSSSRRIPSYFFADDIGEWVVFHLDGDTRSYSLTPQLLRSSDGVALFLTQATPEKHEYELALLRADIASAESSRDIRNTLPDDFAARAILDEQRVIIIARSDKEADRFVRFVDGTKAERASLERRQLSNSGQLRQHFRWSPDNWVRFCAKTAYEALCLFEGSDRCLGQEYSRVRDFVLSPPSRRGRELVFNEHGPLSDRDVPRTLHIDLTVGQDAPRALDALVADAAPGMHVVAVYELEGWVTASVTLAGFPPTLLVLAGPNAHIEDLYQMVYDDYENEFDFVRLAYDPKQPVIPLPIAGAMIESLKRTYRLGAT